MEEKEEGGAGTTNRQCPGQVQVQLAGPGRQQVFGGDAPTAVTQEQTAAVVSVAS